LPFSVRLAPNPSPPACQEAVLGHSRGHRATVSRPRPLPPLPAGIPGRGQPFLNQRGPPKRGSIPGESGGLGLPTLSKFICSKQVFPLTREYYSMGYFASPAIWFPRQRGGWSKGEKGASQTTGRGVKSCDPRGLTKSESSWL